MLGRAASGFDGKGVTLGQSTIKDVDGNTTQTVKLGSIPVTIEIQRNPNEKSTKAKVPEVLERIGQAVAEKGTGYEQRCCSCEPETEQWL